MNYLPFFTYIMLLLFFTCSSISSLLISHKLLFPLPYCFTLITASDRNGGRPSKQREQGKTREPSDSLIPKTANYPLTGTVLFIGSRCTWRTLHDASFKPGSDYRSFMPIYVWFTPPDIWGKITSRASDGSDVQPRLSDNVRCLQIKS